MAIKIINRSLKIPNTERIVGYTGDNLVEVRVFEVNRFYGIEDNMPATEKVAIWKQWLTAQHAAGTPVTVYYQLEQPVVTYPASAIVPTYYPYTKLEQDGAVKGVIEATVKVMDE